MTSKLKRKFVLIAVLTKMTTGLIVTLGLLNTAAKAEESPCSRFQVAVGTNTSCVLTHVGIKCWGDNSGTYMKPPFEIKNPTQLAIGRNHICAITGKGVKCWGDNEFGQSNVPPELINPTQVIAGDHHTCALVDDEVICWGANGSGQSSVPPDLMTPSEIAAGQDYTCAVTSSGVRCWGSNRYVIPNIPSNLKNPRGLATGTSHACVLTDDGVRCWGNGGYWGATSVPAGLANPRELSAAGLHTCAITDNGVICWGRSPLGPKYRYDSHPVTGSSENPIQLASGRAHTCSVTDLGIKCWGYSGYNKPVVPRDLALPKTWPKLIKTIPEKVYQEKKSFLLSTVHSNLIITNEEHKVFLFFVLQQFFQSIDSEWMTANIHPELPAAAEYFKVRYGKSSLADFARESSDLLRVAIRLVSEALIATRSLLTLESQREVSEILLPALAEKLAKTELTPGDAEDIAALFTSHQLAFNEMQNTPRLVPFAKMIEELVRWLGGV